MDILYVSRSKFLEPCEVALNRAFGAKLTDGDEEVLVSLPSGGYAGEITVTIRDDGGSHFKADWHGRDSTRFPVRVRAAATALKFCRRFGRFTIRHFDGDLVIRVHELF